jgi:hypothetical protein
MEDGGMGMMPGSFQGFGRASKHGRFEQEGGEEEEEEEVGGQYYSKRVSVLCVCVCVYMCDCVEITQRGRGGRQGEGGWVGVCVCVYVCMYILTHPCMHHATDAPPAPLSS